MVVVRSHGFAAYTAHSSPWARTTTWYSSPSTTWQLSWTPTAPTPPVVPETPEAREARRTAEHRQRVAAAAEVARQADERAVELLLEHLDETQRAEYVEDRQFHTTSSEGNVFLIRHGRQHNVWRVDADGRQVEEFCGHVSEVVPNADNILMQKLMLEADEEMFRRNCNAFAR